MPVARFLVYGTLLVALLIGARFLRANPDILPTREFFSSISVKDLPTFKKEKREALFSGQSEYEVRKILGTPSATMTVKDTTTLVYSGISLAFVDGKLITTETNLLKRIKKARRSRQ